MYVPKGKLRLLVLKEEHDSMIAGHRGEKTTKVVRSVGNDWLYDLSQIDCMLVDEVNSMSNG